MRQQVLVVLTVTVLACFPIRSNAKDTRPNVVIMLADNLGYSDLSFLGATPGRTPHIDRLARQGKQFHHWNSAAHLCSASRATLLTGKYAARTGIFPSVFPNDATFGLLPFEITIADSLQQEGYATSMVGKWHLGHRKPYLPIKQGFDEWLGIPYHMSGGSLDNHVCAYDEDQTWWLPLYDGETIVEQPVKLNDLAERYATRATSFIRKNAEQDIPFFLYLAFSHVHQLCAPKHGNEQATCQWSGRRFDGDVSQGQNKTFEDAVTEMDWIVGQVTNALHETGAANNTFVLFTSDNGPWLAEQSCSGSKGPWKGTWLAENVEQKCTACPHDFEPDPSLERPRRCRLKGSIPSPNDDSSWYYLDGVHCGEDVGLGSVWEVRNLGFERIRL
jgi:arylsulfatase A